MYHIIQKSRLSNRTVKDELDALNAKSEYTTEERCIGTWIDGKPLYRKMIDFGTLPNNTRKEIKVGIENIKHCHVNISNCIWMGNASDFGSSSETYSLIYTSYITSVYSVGGTNAAINIVTGQSNAANYKALVCLEYTKTTD